MRRSTLAWTLVLVIAGAWLLYRGVSTEMGKVYVRGETVRPENSERTWVEYTETDPADRGQPNVELSIARTVGTWIAALLTLCIFSFLWGDNPFYKFAEAVFVGVTAGYLMVVGFWTGIVDLLLGKLLPALMRDTLGLLPGLPEDRQPDWLYLVPLALSIMLLMRLSPQGGWIARWPLAFIIGATAGFRMLGYFESDFVRQIQNTLLPLIVLTDGSFNFWASVRNTVTVVGVLTTLTYFFFSVEHTGLAGRVSRLGIWFLMLTFGAMFGYIVMSRISLLAERLEFLLDDWLWLIDPLSRRSGI
jgi:hypothetical protein